MRPGTSCAARGRELESHPFSPSIYFVPNPLPESLPFPGNSQSPVAREPADGARREGPGPEKSGNPTGRSPPLAAPRLSPIFSVSGARAVSPLEPRSRTRWLPQPRAWRAGASTRPELWLAGWRARAREGSGAGRAAAGARVGVICWSSGRILQSGPGEKWGGGGGGGAASGSERAGGGARRRRRRWL